MILAGQQGEVGAGQSGAASPDTRLRAGPRTGSTEEHCLQIGVLGQDRFVE
jgi:hypothetical protein